MKTRCAKEMDKRARALADIRGLPIPFSSRPAVGTPRPCSLSPPLAHHPVRAVIAAADAALSILRWFRGSRGSDADGNRVAGKLCSRPHIPRDPLARFPGNVLKSGGDAASAAA